MKALEKALNKIDGYLMSIKRNVVEGHYYLEVGIPKNWVYKATDNIECEVMQETKQGDLIKIYPTKGGIIIDDLIEFVNIIIDTNKLIAKKQEEFDKQLEKAKEQLVEQVKAFEEQIEKLKDHSFEEMSIKQQKVLKQKKETKDDSDEDSYENLEQEVTDKLST